MKVLVINSGSSSIKYQLFDMETEEVLSKGLAERIGIKDSQIKHKAGAKEKLVKMDIPNHEVGIKLILELLQDKEYGVIKSLNEINAVGHRVVHGGEKFSDSVIIDDEVIKAIEECVPLAPLHNPPNLLGIKAMKNILPDVPQVAVFDTAFHHSIPKHAYIYGFPYDYYEKYKIRRYGFHGTSHYYVAHRAAQLVGKPIEELKIITCHLGNGSSITAVKHGKSVDTSLGFGTVTGVLMGTRTGDIDPVALLYIMEHENLDLKAASDLIHKKSGIKGLSGLTNDLRDIEEKAQQGNERAKLTLDILCYGIVKYIGAYTAAMNGTDIIVFTAGIGENSATVREKVCQNLTFLGVELDEEKNKNMIRGKEGEITTENSKVKVFVVPTNEELVIARDTKRLVQNQNS